jgi:hypothetical protein
VCSALSSEQLESKGSSIEQVLKCNVNLDSKGRFGFGAARADYDRRGGRHYWKIAG